MILFRKVRDEFGWLSNMSPHPVGAYRTAEALFQASRFDDPEIQREIRECASPMAAKMIAKAYAEKMIIVPRSEEDVALMRRVVRAKASQHSALVQALLATGDAVIVEDVSARQNESGLFWGGVVDAHGFVRGSNWLGRIWMDLRAELQEVV